MLRSRAIANSWPRARTAAVCITGLPPARGAARCARWIAQYSSKRSAKRRDNCARCRGRRAPASKARDGFRGIARPAAAAGAARLRAHRSALRRSRGLRARARRDGRRAAALRQRGAAAWLPVKMRADFDQWFASLLRAVQRPTLASLLWVHPSDSRAALNGSALVVVNPPYLVEQACASGCRSCRPARRRHRRVARYSLPAEPCRAPADDSGHASGTAPSRVSTATLPPPAGSNTPRNPPRENSVRRRTFSCGISITVIVPSGGLHHQVRTRRPRNGHGWHRPPARRSNAHRRAQHIGDCRRRQRLVHIPTTRLSLDVFDHFAGQRGADETSRNHRPRTAPAPPTRPAQNAAPAQPRLRNCARGSSSAARTRAIERQRLVAEAAACRAAARWAATSAGSACGSAPMCSAPGAFGGRSFDVLRRLRGHRWCAAGCARETGASAPRPA